VIALYIADGQVHVNFSRGADPGPECACLRADWDAGPRADICASYRASLLTDDMCRTCQHRARCHAG
jgi:hypothetical protein